MIMTTKEIGDFGEKAAEDYLVEMDYLILERNYRLKFGEIDIIAAKDGGLVFVEVKYFYHIKSHIGIFHICINHCGFFHPFLLFAVNIFARLTE